MKEHYILLLGLRRPKSSSCSVSLSWQIATPKLSTFGVSLSDSSTNNEVNKYILPIMGGEKWMNAEKYRIHLVKRLKIANWFFQCQFKWKLAQTLALAHLPYLTSLLPGRNFKSRGRKAERVLLNHRSKTASDFTKKWNWLLGIVYKLWRHLTDSVGRECNSWF